MRGLLAICTRVDPVTWDVFFRWSTTPEGGEEFRLPSVCQQLVPGGPLTPVGPVPEPGAEFWFEMSNALPAPLDLALIQEG